MIKKCKYCGKEFEPKNPHQEYCCVSCRSKANNEKYLTKKLGRIPKRLCYQERICKNCEKTYMPTMGHQMFCCDDCRVEFYKKNKIYAKKYKPKEKKEPMECVICGKMFVPRDKRQKTCGDYYCKTKYANMKKRGTLAKYMWQRKRKNTSQSEFEFFNVPLSECMKRCRKLGLTYGEAQGMAYNGILPKEW